jgi:hypothetical protein
MKILGHTRFRGVVSFGAPDFSFGVLFRFLGFFPTACQVTWKGFDDFDGSRGVIVFWEQFCGVIPGLLLYVFGVLLCTVRRCPFPLSASHTVSLLHPVNKACIEI